MKKTTLIILCLMFTIFSIRQAEAGKVNVVVTLPCLADITEQVGGDNVKVYSITRGVQDPHYIDAKPSYMVKLHKADLLIYSGLELEIGWLPLLIQGARNNKVTVGSEGNLNASSALHAEKILEKPRGEVDRSMGDVHPAGNPHYLLNPQNAVHVAKLIAGRLSQIDSKNSAQYEQNYESFKKKVNEKLLELRPKISRLKGKNLVCYHVHWSYLLDWLNINTAGLIELRPGIPPTPKHKKFIIELMENKDIEVVIISSWKEPTKAREVAAAAGAKLVILPGEVSAMTGADDYLSWIDYMVSQLDNAFSGENQTASGQNRERNRKRIRGAR